MWRASVSAATQTTEYDTIGRSADAESGLPAQTRGCGEAHVGFDGAASNHREPDALEQIFGPWRDRGALLDQDAIAINAGSLDLGQRSGSSADLGTNASSGVLRCGSCK